MSLQPKSPLALSFSSLTSILIVSVLGQTNRLGDCLLFWCRLAQFFADPWWQVFNPLDVRGHGPQLLIRVPFAVRKHPGIANTMFRNPKDLRLGIRSSL